MAGSWEVCVSSMVGRWVGSMVGGSGWQCSVGKLVGSLCCKIRAQMGWQIACQHGWQLVLAVCFAAWLADGWADSLGAWLAAWLADGLAAWVAVGVGSLCGSLGGSSCATFGWQMSWQHGWEMGPGMGWQMHWENGWQMGSLKGCFVSVSDLGGFLKISCVRVLVLLPWKNEQRMKARWVWVLGS